MRFYPFLKTYIGAAFTFFASLCSIASLVLLFINTHYAVIVALVIYGIGVTTLVGGFLFGINKMVHDNSKEEYKRISSIFIFQSNDGVKSTFEIFRTIQCKRLFLTEIPYSFKWSGSIVPKLESRIHKLGPLRHDADKNKWDDTIIQFKHPLKYNECTVINVKTENDDTDGLAKPWISSRLESPIEMMTYRVLLAYKDSQFNKPAIFERKKIDSQIDGDYVTLESVPFDKEHKSYFYCATNPEPGFIYRLRWEK